MKTLFRIQNDEAQFIINGIAPEYAQAARELYFQPIEDYFAKTFPASTDHLERIFQNFQSVIEDMLLQTAGRQPVPWPNALETFLNCIEGQDINWYLVGSTALAVRGIKVSPRDLDIVLVDEASILRVRDLMLEYTVEPFARSKNWIARWFGRGFMSARIEFVGEVLPSVDSGLCDFGPVAAQRLESVLWWGKTIYVPPIDLMLAVSEQRGLVERCEAIRDWQSSV